MVCLVKKIFYSSQGLNKTLMYAIMTRLIVKNKNHKMQKISNKIPKQIRFNLQSLVIFGVLVIFAIVTPTIGIVSANTTDEIQDIKKQIQAIENTNDAHEHEQGILSVQANSLAEAIQKLQAQINRSQARINSLEAEVAKLEKQIIQTEKELEIQKDLLGKSIKQMYVSGEISTIEMLATSKDLSDFFDRQQYQEDVQKEIKNTLDKITELKLQLNAKKEQVKVALSEQQSIKSQIQAQQSEKNRILSLNEAEQAELESKIQNNNEKIAELRQKQIEAEAALARALNTGSYKVSPVGPIAAGAVVGSIGNTGLSSGPHLHLEVRKKRSSC